MKKLIRFIRNNLVRISLTTFVALTLFLLTFVLWSLPWLAGDEKLMIWSTSAVKLGFREAPSSDQFALINVSHDLKLIDQYDEFGFPIGNQAITDREKLTRLFEMINQSAEKPEYVLLDIFFESDSRDDSLLEMQLHQLDNVVLSCHLDEEKNFMTPVIKGGKHGLSDYVIGNIFEGVYKYQLYFNDSLKLTPLIMAEDIHDFQSTRKGALVDNGDFWTLNYFIINYRILQKDIDDQEAGFNPVNLGELLVLPEDDVAAFLAGKVVVIGDFLNSDMHETIFEIMSGPVILLNAYLNIVNQDTYVNALFFLVLGVVYFLLAYLAISPDDLIEKYIRKRYSHFKVLRNLSSFMSYMIILVITSIFLYFIFNIHLNVFFIAVYLFLIEKITQFIQARIKQPKKNLENI